MLKVSKHSICVGTECADARTSCDFSLFRDRRWRMSHFFLLRDGGFVCWRPAYGNASDQMLTHDVVGMTTSSLGEEAIFSRCEQFFVSGIAWSCDRRE